VNYAKEQENYIQCSECAISENKLLNTLNIDTTTNLTLHRKLLIEQWSTWASILLH